MFCGNCGNKINDGDIFCGGCGWKVPQSAVETVPAPEPIVEVINIPANSEEVSINDTVDVPSKDEEVSIPDGIDNTVRSMEQISGAEVKKCPNCGKPVENDWQVCPFCKNQIVEQEFYCFFCNKKLKSEICPYCNNKTVVDNKNQNIQSAHNNTDENNAEQLKKKLKNTKIGLIVTIVLTVGMGIGLLFLYNECSWYESRYWSLFHERYTLQRNYDSLKNNYEQAEQAISKIINVTSLRVGNTDENNRWLTNAGGRLVSSEMRYLNPVITYNSTISGEVTFYIKIIEPNGSLKTGTSSPEGYSTSSTVMVNRGINQTLTLIGWGNSNRSSYPAGEYKVEIWYGGICLISQKVTIY